MQRSSTPADTNWRTAARSGSKATPGSKPGVSFHRRRRKFPRSLPPREASIPTPTADAARNSGRSGRRRSTAQPCSAHARILLVVVLFVLLSRARTLAIYYCPLVRTSPRMTIRLSIGAGRARFMKQLLTEGLDPLGFRRRIGGLLSRIGARRDRTPYAAARWRAASARRLDWRVSRRQRRVCLSATLLFGLVPALSEPYRSRRRAKAESGGVVGPRGTWVRSAWFSSRSRSASFSWLARAC